MRVAFHSYKGGVGRTKVMVGLGALLAMQGYRVGMLDFDLDASGLATIFDAEPEQLGPFELLNILHPNGNLSNINNAMDNVTDFVTKRFKVKPKKNGKLIYLPTVSDPRLSDAINLGKLAGRVQDLLEYIEDECGIDWLFLDIKPGYSPSARVVLPMADRVVMVARLDSQNIEGVKRFLPKLMDDGLNLQPILLANMVPENKKTEGRIQKLVSACGHAVDIRLPYDPELVFDDDIAWAENPNSPMYKGLEKLAELLVKA